MKASNAKAPMLIDMHDLGDMLADNGFYDPVTDTAKLELSYKKAGTFWQDMETFGIVECVEVQQSASG